jgi:hypothetical protein
MPERGDRSFEPYIVSPQSIHLGRDCRPMSGWDTLAGMRAVTPDTCRDSPDTSDTAKAIPSIYPLILALNISFQMARALLLIEGVVR